LHQSQNTSLDSNSQPCSNRTEAAIQLTISETQNACKSLGNKAIGTDGLKDTLIKSLANDEAVIKKLCDSFNMWLRNN